MKRILASLAAVLLAGCASQPLPVLLQGDAVSIAWLAGSWNGEYWGASNGRRGTIDFYLQSGTDSLYGDVMMTDTRGNVIQPVDPADRHSVHVRSSQQLHIDVAVVHADSVRGTLEPYRSPDCDCTVTTTFLGRVAGNTIAGTFQTRGAGGVRAEGQWRVSRSGTGRP